LNSAATIICVLNSSTANKCLKYKMTVKHITEEIFILGKMKYCNYFQILKTKRILANNIQIADVFFFTNSKRVNIYRYKDKQMVQNITTSIH
jgi:hypothetical protein